ncbi:MAG: DUF47 family protein [Eubacteriales bacterium]|nr:DUF47 family protein [Eubacteriales bacterium]MDD4324551.1 DUF47 family protein [Eubacteriales bacterium]MDD4541731.1 DUF47 family protein [Eubacteriales bacterium]
MAIFKRGKKVDFFGLLLDLSEYTIQAANFLEEILLEYDHASLPESLVEMHDIEHTADLMLHDLNHKLARGYTRQVKKEDVSDIAYLIDEVTDKTEDILMRFDMFNVHKLRSEAVEFAKLISRGSVTQANMIKEFRNFKTSLRVRESIVEINNIEEEGDRLYARSVRRLYRESNDPVEIIAWTEIFYRFERCCDSFEDVAQHVESIIIKNT